MTVLAAVVLFLVVFGFSVVSASAGWITGKFGKTYDFANSTYFDAGNVYNGVKTIAFWVKNGNTANGKVIDLNGTDYVSIVSGAVSATDFTATIYVDGVAGSTISDSNWHYVVLTTAEGQNASAVKFGSVDTNNLNGALDDVKFYNYALSAREINEKYRGGGFSAPSLALGGTIGGSLYVMNSGYMGIGTTTPATKLDVWGSFQVGTSSRPVLYANAGSTYVGLGTTTPNYNLDILGTSGVGSLHIASSSGASMFLVGQYGNVGIATSAPSAKLDILGRSGWPSFHVASSTGANQLSINEYGLINFGIPDNQTTAMTISEGSNAYLTFDTTNSAEKITVGKNLEVGPIEVDADSGVVNFVNMNIVATTTATGTVESLAVAIDGTAIATFYGESSGYTATLQNPRVGIGTTTPATKLDVWGSLQVGTSSTPVLYVNTGSQHIGIGTTTPNARLSILGTINQPSFHIASSTGSTIFHVDEYGNLGIATSAPTAKLDILGTAGWPSIHIASSSGANQLSIDGYGLVSIGIPDNQTTAMTINEGSNTYLTFDTTDSAEKIVVGKNLEVGPLEIDADSGSVQFVNMNISTTTATGTAEKLSVSLDQQSILTVYGEANGQGSLQNMRVGISSSTPSAMLTLQGNASTSGPLLQISTSTTQAFYIDPSGYIGIGTTTPAARLAMVGVAGLPSIQIASSSGSTMFYLGQYGNLSLGNVSPAARLDIAEGRTAGTIINADYEAATTLTGSVLGLNLDLSTNVTPGAYNVMGQQIILPSGGTGTTTFASWSEGSSEMYNFSPVSAQFNVPASFNAAGDVSLAYDLVFTNNSAAYVTFNGPGYVRTDDASGNYDLTLSAANAGDVVVNDNLELVGGLQLDATTTQTVSTTTTVLVGNATHIVLTATSSVVLSSAPTIADGLAGQVVIIRGASTTATVTLQDQDTLASSNLQLGSTSRQLGNSDTLALMFDGADWVELWFSGGIDADYAEMYKIKEDVAAGDIVSLSDDYLKAGKAVLGDKNVAGIISAQPAYLIGQEFRDEMQMPVALAGRVPVNISLEAGEIKKGDWLVPSTRPGYAMKYNADYLRQMASASSSPAIEIDLSNVPLIGIALGDFSSSTISDLIDVSYQTYRVRFGNDVDSSQINRLNARYKARNITTSTIEIRSNYAASYLKEKIIDGYELISERTEQQPNPEFQARGNNEQIMCLVRSGFVNANNSRLSNASKLTVDEENGKIVLGTESEFDSVGALSFEIDADGFLAVSKLKAGELEVGSNEKRTGITLYDEETGAPYCMKIKAGAMISLPGKCEDLNSSVTETVIPSVSTSFSTLQQSLGQAGASEESPNPETPNPEISPESSTTTTETSTTTETASAITESTTTTETATTTAPVETTASEPGSSTSAEPATTTVEQAQEQPAGEPATE